MLHSSVKSVPLSTLLPGAGVSVPQLDENDVVRLQMDVMGEQKRTACVELGCTKVMCSIDGPKEPTGKSGDCIERNDGGEINVFVKRAQMVITSGPSHNDIGQGESRTLNDLKFALHSALRTIIYLDSFRKAQIDVEVTILEDDGCALSAALLAASLALSSAGIHVYDVCVASTVVMLADGRCLVNPNLSAVGEVNSCNSFSVTFGMMPSIQQIVCCQAKGVCNPKQLKDAIQRAKQSALRIYPLMRETIDGYIKNEQ